MYVHSEGHDEGGHAVAREYAHGHANLKQGQPHRLFVLTVFVNPDGVVHQQKHLAHPSGKATEIGRHLLAAHHEQPQRDLQKNQCDERQRLRIKMLIQSASEDAH